MVINSNSNWQIIFSIEISINSQNGKEDFFRIPVETSAQTGWRRVDAQVPLGDSQQLNLIIAGITATAQKGELLIDGMMLNLLESSQHKKAIFNAAGHVAVTTSKNRNRNLARGQIVKGSSFWANGYGYDNLILHVEWAKPSVRRSAHFASRPYSCMGCPAPRMRLRCSVLTVQTKPDAPKFTGSVGGGR